MSFLQHKVFISTKSSDYRGIRNNLKLLSNSFSTKIFATREVLTGDYGRKFFLLDLLDAREVFRLALSLNSNRFQFNKILNLSVFKIKGHSFAGDFPDVFKYCFECLWNITLLPFVESNADRFSFGYRPFRICYGGLLEIKKMFLKNKKLNNSLINIKVAPSLNLRENWWLLNNIPIEKATLKSWFCYKGLFVKQNILEDLISLSENNSFYFTLFNYLFNGLVWVIL